MTFAHILLKHSYLFNHLALILYSVYLPPSDDQVFIRLANSEGWLHHSPSLFLHHMLQTVKPQS